jgi:hypothetical protein
MAAAASGGGSRTAHDAYDLVLHGSFFAVVSIFHGAA